MAKLQGDRLNHEHLRHWADELGVLDLLERLLFEVEKKASDPREDAVG